MTTAAEDKYREAAADPPPRPEHLPEYPPTTVSVVTAASSTGVLPPPVPPKRLCDAYVLAIGLGFLGAHHFYLSRPGWGVLYLCTFGLLGVGYLVDWFRVPFLVKDANRRLCEPDAADDPQVSLGSAYLLWFPLGLFGTHHFYMRRWVWGFAYLFTVGLFGIGWLIDACRMPHLVKVTNQRLLNKAATPPRERQACEAYVLCLVPFTGLLGGHHYYLGRYGFGALYTCTLGLFGVGWLVDICRLTCLVSRVNREMEEGKTGRAYLDDAYLCAFPLGFLGLHHFYLRRPGWGVLYLCTFGVFGIGWVIDWFRLPCLVSDHNKALNCSEESPIITSTTIGVVSPGMVNPGMAPGPPGYEQGGYPALPYTGQVPYPPQAGVHPPPHPYPQGPYPQGGGLDSWSTIASSDVGHESPCPPSYQEATGDKESAQNSLNENVPPPK